jgi:hypothetical protein
MLYELFKRAIEQNNTIWSKTLLRLQVEQAYTLFKAIDETQYNELVDLLTPA